MSNERHILFPQPEGVSTQAEPTTDDLFKQFPVHNLRPCICSIKRIYRNPNRLFSNMALELDWYVFLCTCHIFLIYILAMFQMLLLRGMYYCCILKTDQQTPVVFSTSSSSLNCWVSLTKVRFWVMVRLVRWLRQPYLESARTTVWIPWQWRCWKVCMRVCVCVCVCKCVLTCSLSPSQRGLQPANTRRWCPSWRSSFTLGITWTWWTCWGPAPKLTVLTQLAHS